MSQLVLDLVTSPRFTIENLVLHEGIENAVATILTVYGRSEGMPPPLFLLGPSGSGKTHILHAAASLVAARSGAGSEGIRIISPTGNPAVFPGLAELVAEFADPKVPLVATAVDDVHLMEEAEASHLWTLHNVATRSGTVLMVASRVPAEGLFQDNEHLRSRLTSGLVLRLDPPEDQARTLILEKMARDRQVRISPEVHSYLVTRKSRNIKELEKIIGILDLASLKRKRRITLPFIKTLEKEGTI